MRTTSAGHLPAPVREGTSVFVLHMVSSQQSTVPSERCEMTSSASWTNVSAAHPQQDRGERFNRLHMARMSTTIGSGRTEGHNVHKAQMGHEAC
mmetsp:Transcript_91815/g.182420  ORF Transcript_91815/g.182420 Transcript_91815/m.182420 type:complete len:94 (-) Transcript_91815:9-290(-)